MKKILVCLDGSPRQKGVLDAAIGLAKRTSAKLVLFRSVGVPSELPAEALSMAMEQVPVLLQDYAEKGLRALEGTVPAELRGGVSVAIGTPWQAIEQGAVDSDADLILVGSHGYGALDRVLGTTAAKVVNHATRSVLVVRDPARLA